MEQEDNDEDKDEIKVNHVYLLIFPSSYTACNCMSPCILAQSHLQSTNFYHFVHVFLGSSHVHSSNLQQDETLPLLSWWHVQVWWRNMQVCMYCIPVCLHNTMIVVGFHMVMLSFILIVYHTKRLTLSETDSSHVISVLLFVVIQ